MRIFVLILSLTSLSSLGQVGINTVAPTSMLDVNGNARVRTLPATTDEATARTRIVAADVDGNLQTTTSKAVIMSHLKSFVKGGFSTAGTQTITLPFGVGSAKLVFNSEDFDENNEYDRTVATFTASNPGIYSVDVQIKSTSGLGVATNFGVAILKNGVVVAQSGYANVNVAFVAVTPPIRQVHKIQKLAKGDTITFAVYSDLLSAGLLGTRTDSFFTIAQEQ